MTWWGYILTTVWLGLCAWYDARERSVPNALTMPPLLLAGYTAYMAGRLDLMAVVFAAVYAAFLLRTLGPADGKLAVALAGLWPEALVAGAAVLALWFLVLRLRGGEKQAVPGAVGLFGGTIVALTRGVWACIMGADRGRPVWAPLFLLPNPVYPVRGGVTMGELWRFLTGTEGEMIDRALLVAFIVLAGLAIWRSIGQKLAAKLRLLDRAI